MIDSSHGWSGARIVSSVTPRTSIEADVDGELAWPPFARAHEARMRDLAAEIDLEPVGRIVPRDIGVELTLGPFGEAGAEFGLRRGDALRAIDLGEAAGQHRFGFVIKRAQQLRLPAIPDAGADRADVGGGEDGQQFHPLERLHHCGEILDGLAVGQVARLRHFRHRQMLLDQPGDQFGIGWLKPSRGQSRRATLAPAIE